MKHVFIHPCLFLQMKPCTCMLQVGEKHKIILERKFKIDPVEEDRTSGSAWFASFWIPHRKHGYETNLKSQLQI